MISSSIPSTSRMTSILHSPSRLLLPFRVVVFRRWIDDGGEAEVLIVFLHLFFFPFRVSSCCRASARAHRRQMLCVCVCECVYNPRRSDRACVYVRVNVFVHYSWVSEFHLSSHLFNKTTKKSRLAHGCTPRPRPPPLLCDFSWQFVSLNVWWHVHLLLLYMCITGYKGVFEHSKHVRFSLVSGWTPCLSFWVGTWAAVSNFFFFVVVIIRPKPSIVRDFQFFPFLLSYLLTVRYFWWAIEEEAKSLCCCCCCWWNLSLFIIWFNQYFFNTFSNQTEKSQSLLLFFKARSNRISISVYSFSYSLTKKEILKKNAIQLLRGGN